MKKLTERQKAALLFINSKGGSYIERYLRGANLPPQATLRSLLKRGLIEQIADEVGNSGWALTDSGELCYAQWDDARKKLLKENAIPVSQVEEYLTSFLYSVMRDAAPVGEIERIVQEEQNTVGMTLVFTNKSLEAIAANHSKRLVKLWRRAQGKRGRYNKGDKTP